MVRLASALALAILLLSASPVSAATAGGVGDESCPRGTVSVTVPKQPPAVKLPAGNYFANSEGTAPGLHGLPNRSYVGLCRRTRPGTAQTFKLWDDVYAVPFSPQASDQTAGLPPAYRLPAGEYVAVRSHAGGLAGMQRIMESQPAAHSSPWLALVIGLVLAIIASLRQVRSSGQATG